MPGLVARLEERLVLLTRLEKLAPGAAVIRRAKHVLGEVHLLLAVHDRLGVHGEVAVMQLLDDVVAQLKVRVADERLAGGGAGLHADARTDRIGLIRTRVDEVEGDDAPGADERLSVCRLTALPMKAMASALHLGGRPCERVRRTP